MSTIGVTIGGRTYRVQVEAHPQSDAELTVTVEGATLPVTVQSFRDPESLDWILIDNRSYEIVVDRDLQWIAAYGQSYRVTVSDLEAKVTRPASGDGRIKAPIPGIITSILVGEGDRVEAGQPVLVLEAMKMENEIRATRGGVVKTLSVVPGQGVSLNEILAEIE